MSERLSGRCLCGTVVFSAALPSLFCAHCHCDYCRLAHGAAFVTWTGVREDGFSIDQGRDALCWFSSSKQSRRGFCQRCGTTMLYASDAAAGEMHIATACIETPLDRTPTAHVFVDHKVGWLDLAPGPKEVPGSSEALAKFRVIEKRR